MWVEPNGARQPGRTALPTVAEVWERHEPYFGEQIVANRAGAGFAGRLGFTVAAVGKSPAAEFGAKRETLELVRNFMNIPPESRNHFLLLAESLVSSAGVALESAGD